MTRGRGGSLRCGTRASTPGSRSGPTSHAAATPAISTGSPPAGCVAACSGTARWVWKPAALSWGTVQLRIDSALVFDAFLAGRDVPGPWLADGPDQVRALLLDFLGHVRGLRVQQPGPTHGQPLSQSRVFALLGGVEQFYLFMHDHRETAAASLAEPGWLRLGLEHAVFFRRGEKPRRSRHRSHERDVIDADAFAQIMAGTGLLGTPTAEGGLGDEQAMRILMLLARTGRRVSEICMLDHDPLLPLHQPGTGTADDADGFVARLRYQQTKIDGAPDTILVDREIVAIIRAQQDWVRRCPHRPTQRRPKYLFVAGAEQPPWRPALLGSAAARADRRTGPPARYPRQHRRAGGLPAHPPVPPHQGHNLLNAGVPLHVVQRYLGHLTPTMTMIYAQTLQSTAEPSSCATARSPPMPATSRSTRRTSTTCSSWTGAPTGSCPTAGACCRPASPATRATPA